MKNKDSDLLTSQSGFNIICLQKNQLLTSEFLKFIFKDPFNLAVCEFISIKMKEMSVNI